MPQKLISFGEETVIGCSAISSGLLHLSINSLVQ